MKPVGILLIEDNPGDVHFTQEALKFILALIPFNLTELIIL